MADVRDLLTATTPDAAELGDVDYDAVARRGARRRIGKRLVAAAAAVAVVVGGVEVVRDGLGTTDPPIIAPEPAFNGQWSTTAVPPLRARHEPFVDVLGDGRVVVAGGETAFREVEAADGRTFGGTVIRRDGAIYDPAQDAWRPLPEVPLDSTAAFAVVDDQLWAFEAFPAGVTTIDGDGISASGVAVGPEAWNAYRMPLDETSTAYAWQRVPSPPTHVSDGRAEPPVILGGHAVVLPGVHGRGGVSLWDGSGWQTLPSAPLQPRVDAVVVADEDAVLVWGGRPSESDPTDSAGWHRFDDGAVLDLASGEWTAVDAGPLGAVTSEDVAAVTRDGRALLVRSATCCEEPTPAAAAWLELDQGTWEGAPLPFIDQEVILSAVARGRSPLAPADQLVIRATTQGERVRTEQDGRVTEGVAMRLGDPPRLVDFAHLTKDGTWEALGMDAETWADADGPSLAFPETLLVDDEVVGLARPGFRATGEEELPQVPTTRLWVRGDDGWVDATVPADVEGLRYVLSEAGVVGVGGLPYQYDASAEPWRSSTPQEFETDPETGLRYPVKEDPLSVFGVAHDDDAPMPAWLWR